MNEPTVARLVRQFTPEHYNLSIEAKAEELTFKGTVTIYGTLPEASNNIRLHADSLNILSAKLNEPVQGSLQTTVDKDNQELILSSELPLKGSVEIEISFEGVITKPMHGLYPCFFIHNETEKRLLATQFESHHAREVFPCIDEPEAKATFQLTLTTPTDDVVVSNTPILSEERSEKREDEVAQASNIKHQISTKTTTFEKTPKMSTYLLAWVQGELTYEEATTKHGVTVRAYSTPVHTGKTQFGLQIACDALDFMDDYFDTPYPLPKCDIIALPDFAAGAMENWGCITFRESAMLIDEQLSDLHDKQHVAEVVVHELAHQWFGNLVTMRWWEDLWLNEGFASWVPYLVLDALKPEWTMWDQFSSGDLMSGMKADALEHTHPIVVKINSPEEIRSAFDSISYDKGCSVIHLLHEYIGADAFKVGIRAYLKKHAYSNAETSDLWAAFSESSNLDVANFMGIWTEQSGFPIVHVKSTETTSELKQERFFVNPVHAVDKTIWPIPLMRNNQRELFDTKESIVEGALKLNSGQRGFYRAVYQGPLFESLKNDIANNRLSISDSVGLLTDTAESAKAGYASSTQTLELIETLSSSESEALFGTALGELAAIRAVLHETYEPMKPFVLKLVSRNLERLGYEQKQGESVDDELLRPAVLAAASYAGHKPTVAWALGIFDNATSPADIRPDIRGVIYSTAVREYGNLPTYEKIVRWYDTNEIPGENVALTSSIAQFKSPELIERSLSRITTDAVKLQDSFYWIAYLMFGRFSKQTAWDWLKNNWGWVGENFGKEKEVDYYLRFSANGFASLEHLKDYDEFFSSANIFGSQRAFEQGKETITWQQAWKSRDEQKVIDWLNSKQ